MDIPDFRFGSFTYDAAQSLLLRGSDPVTLGRRGLLLLELLLRRRGAVVAKSDLIDAAWPGEAIEESNLSVQISQLRKAIGSHWIRTVERIGYQFIATSPAGETASAARIGPPAVLVMPFADLSPTGEFRRLSAGLLDDLATTLGRFKSLVMRTYRTGDGSMPDSRHLAHELGVHYVLDGSIRQSGKRLRISAQLLDGASGAHVWADSFDCAGPEPAVDALAAAVEAQVHAAEIVRSRRERPDSMEAYDLYLRARFKILSSRETDNAAAMALYSRALELEPDNRLYLAGAAEALHHRRVVGWQPLSPSDRRRTLEFGHRGLDQPDADAVSVALFGNAFFTAEDVELGAAMTERAAQMNGNSPLALICDGLSHLWAGSVDQAELLFTRSISLNPADPSQRFALGGLATVHRIRENYEECLAAAKRANAMSLGYSIAHWNMIVSSVYLGRMDDARRYLARYRALAPGVTVESIRSGQPYIFAERSRTLLDGLRRAGLPER
jgi:TolB-like protein